MSALAVPVCDISKLTLRSCMIENRKTPFVDYHYSASKQKNKAKFMHIINQIIIDSTMLGVCAIEVRATAT